MRYFKSSEIVKIYGVSNKTVHNWITSSGVSNNLEIINVGTHRYIADTLGNTVEINRLVKDGKKYINSNNKYLAKPTIDFYKSYTDEQIGEIIVGLQNYHSIPFRLRYCGPMSKLWCKYLSKLEKSEGDNILNGSLDFIEDTQKIRRRIIPKNINVNIFDINCANALSTKGLVYETFKNGNLNNYFAIDVSEGLVNEACRVINEIGIPNTVISRNILDISKEDITTLAYSKKSMKIEDTGTSNIFLLLGGTILNYERPDIVLHNISAGMLGNDYLIITTKLDSMLSRNFFDFSTPSNISELSSHDSKLLEMMGLDSSIYTVKQTFSKDTMCRSICVSPKRNVCFKIKSREHEISIDIPKGTELSMLRINHYSEIDMVSMCHQAGLRVIEYSISQNGSFMGLIAQKY